MHRLTGKLTPLCTLYELGLANKRELTKGPMKGRPATVAETGTPV